MAVHTPTPGRITRSGPEAGNVACIERGAAARRGSLNRYVTVRKACGRPTDCMITDPDALRPTTDSHERGLSLDRSTVMFLASASVLIVAGGAVAAVNSATPFGHGSWLAAYLVLVGGVSQGILGAGRLALHAPPLTRAVPAAQLALWNIGSLAVPAGVLGDAPTLVTAGSVALLSALALFAAEARGRRRDVRGRALAYLAIVVGLAVSVVIGSALADAAPGAWL
jgi:hypothetical protein